MEELKAQTNFTAEELQDWYKEFRSSWPKGVLTVEEFKKAYSSYFPLGDASEFAKHVFRVFDQNDDGRLDFREFICGFSVGLRGSVEEKLKFSFRIYDVDGNGFISPEEMVEIFTVRNTVCLLQAVKTTDSEYRTRDTCKSLCAREIIVLILENYILP